MICFGAKRDQEMKKKRTCEFHFKIKKNINKIKIKRERERDGRGRGRDSCFYFYFIFFFCRFSLRYTEIGKSEFVGARTKRLYLTKATRGNQKHGISPSFQLKFGKSFVLVFLKSTAFCRSELVGVEGQIDPRIESYA